MDRVPIPSLLVTRSAHLVVRRRPPTVPFGTVPSHGTSADSSSSPRLAQQPPGQAEKRGGWNWPPASAQRQENLQHFFTVWNRGLKIPRRGMITLLRKLVNLFYHVSEPEPPVYSLCLACVQPNIAALRLLLWLWEK